MQIRLGTGFSNHDIKCRCAASPESDREFVGLRFAEGIVIIGSGRLTFSVLLCREGTSQDWTMSTSLL